MTYKPSYGANSLTKSIDPASNVAVLNAVTVVSQQELLADLRSHMERGDGFSVATMNLDHIVKLREDPKFRQAYSAQTHVTADGRPIVWLCRLAGRNIELVTGSDLVEPLVSLCADANVPIGLFGSTPEALNIASDRLKARFAGLKIECCLSPPMGFEPDGAAARSMVQELAASGARVIFLALGAPKQEVFAASARTDRPDLGFVSVGAGIDFVAGTQIRAPRLVRKLALEWFWRLSTNPRRMLGRYARCVTILPGLTRSALGMRKSAVEGKPR